jgi:hypothetical protein
MSAPLKLKDESHMKEQRAREILQALVQGIDPMTGEELPSGTVIQHAAVLRALLAGVTALEQSVARSQRRAQLPGNVGRAWTKEEERHGRTLRAIEARLERLGLLTAEQRSTNNSFVTPTKGGTGGTGGAGGAEPP